MPNCFVSGTLTKHDGAPAINEPFTITIFQTPSDAQGLRIKEILELHTGNDGTFGIDIEQGAYILFRAGDLVKELTIPAVSNISI